MLNRLSLAMSVVGRTGRLVGAVICRRWYLPLMILILTLDNE
jgi:hypothetical protein